MTKKNTLTCLDSHRQYAVIGLDLAKYDVSVAAIPVMISVRLWLTGWSTPI